MSDHVYAQGEIFAAVRRLLKKYHAERAILLGSYARQEADTASNIDLIVVGGSRFDPISIERARCLLKSIIAWSEKALLLNWTS